MSGPHAPVMLREVLEALAPQAGEAIVDGTFGAGGYSRGILATGASVIGFDRDPSVRPFAAPLEAEGRFRLVNDRFSTLAGRLGPASVDGVVFDLGVSSMQLDQAERGFSFMRDGPLDMRMGDAGPTAADIVNEYEPGDLVRLLRLYGEEPNARRMVAAVVRRRAQQPFTRTLDLAEVIEASVGGRKGAKTHPATRAFQALRIAVNDELGEVERGLIAAETALKPGGRLVVVTFHSLEDRMVKAFFTERGGNLPSGSRHAPPVAKGAAPSFEVSMRKAVAASEAETAGNPRARSAKLRWGTRTAAPAWGQAGGERAGTKRSGARRSGEQRE
jgi:16S rRNA (cytosine1402-N4)-methyltransferase